MAEKKQDFPIKMKKDDKVKIVTCKEVAELLKKEGWK